MEKGIINLEVAKQNLLDIREFLARIDTPFWLMFGTFLGLYRDGELIPYDDDTDLAIYDEDQVKILSHVGLIRELGFSGHRWETRVTLYRGGEHTDIYFFKLEGDKRTWFDLQIDRIDFEVSNQIDYLGKKWRILGNPEKWLRYIYGDTWRIPIAGLQAQTYPRGEVSGLANARD